MVIHKFWGFPGGSVVKNPHAIAGDTWVGKIPLEEKMATHSNILTWEIPWTEEPGRLQSMGVTKELDKIKQLSTHACR